jgi:bifunctional DNase/RNase
MSSSATVRTTFVILLLAACAAGALFRLLSPVQADDAVAMTTSGIVRVRGGQSLVVLVEKSGSRRLAVPVTRAEAALIDDALRGGTRLGAAAIEALGGRVLRASIDDALSLRRFRGHLAIEGGSGEVRLEASAGEAISLALQAGAAIVAARALLEEAGVSPDELRGKPAHEIRSESAPAPVLGI